METQTRLSRHKKFISAENITILSVSSDDYLHASLLSQSSKCGVKKSGTLLSPLSHIDFIFAEEIYSLL